MEPIVKLVSGEVVRESDLFIKIASFLYCETATKTDYNNWSIHFSDVEEVFQLPKGFLTIPTALKIAKVASQEFEKQIISCDVTSELESENYFDVTLWSDYIPGWTQEDPAFDLE